MVAKGHSKSKFNHSMCVELINMFQQGKTRAAFCARHNISEQGFSQWVEKYPLFADAYDVALAKAKKYYEDIAHDHLIEEHQGPKLNTKLFGMIMRNRFEMPQNRIVKLRGMAARTSEDKLNAICEAIEAGSITPDEAQKLASLVNVSISAQQFEDVLERLEQIEQRGKIGMSDDGFEEVKDDI